MMGNYIKDLIELTENNTFKFTKLLGDIKLQYFHQQIEKGIIRDYKTRFGQRIL